MASPEGDPLPHTGKALTLWKGNRFLGSSLSEWVPVGGPPCLPLESRLQLGEWD